MRFPVPVSIAVAVTVFSMSAIAQEDLDAYRQAARMQNADDRIAAVQSFLEKYPTSTYAPFAHLQMFNAYLEKGNEPEALKAAYEYVTLVPEPNRPMAYNTIAWSLSQKGNGLDTALAYANRAEKTLRETKSRQLSMLLDTKAYVLYALKRYSEAEELQTETIKGNETNPEYNLHLALFQEGSGKRREALETAAKAMILGDFGESLARFNEWIAKEEPSDAGQQKLRNSVVMSVAKSHLDSIPADRIIAEGSKAAKLLANTGVDLKTASKWANSAVRSLKKNSSLQDAVMYNSNLAAVLVAQGKTSDALAVIGKIKGLVAVWQSDFWLMAGGMYEKAKQKENALDAYLTGLVATRNPQIVEAVKNVTSDDIDKLVEKKREAMLEFDPGHYKAPAKASGRVVLAELFTGAECGPCQAADEAFDKLAEYYPRTAVVILEYHVHIPGADPMTTDETHARYLYYGNTGTPTVYFNGQDQMVGGGPKYVAANRFNVYKHTIENVIEAKPTVQISAKAGLKGDDVMLYVTLSAQKPLPDSLVLHTALVERSVDYTGSNGVSKHAFVVRDLLDGAEGMKLMVAKGKVTVEKRVNVADIEKGNTEYLDNPQSHKSWPQRLQNFPGWKARPEKLSRENLAIVAWIQNPRTKEVLQANYVDVSSSLSVR